MERQNWRSKSRSASPCLTSRPVIRPFLRSPILPAILARSSGRFTCGSARHVLQHGPSTHAGKRFAPPHKPSRGSRNNNFTVVAAQIWHLRLSATAGVGSGLKPAPTSRLRRLSRRVRRVEEGPKMGCQNAKLLLRGPWNNWSLRDEVTMQTFHPATGTNIIEVTVARRQGCCCCQRSLMERRRSFPASESLRA